MRAAGAVLQALLIAVVSACTSGGPRATDDGLSKNTNGPQGPPRGASEASAPGATLTLTEVARERAEVDGGVGIATAIRATAALQVLFPEGAHEGIDAAAKCPDATSTTEADRIECLLALRYHADAASLELARSVFARHGHVAGIEVPYRMDGGYRGFVQIEPALPVGKHRKVLAWTLEALDGAKATYDQLAAKSATGMLAYRTRDLTMRFFRTVAKTTPNAYAEGWSIAINVQGSLLTSSSALRETLVHEMFHLNDAAHADWSMRLLGGVYGDIVKKCGAKTACLAPYAPNDTIVRNGTYYAFQPGNDVREYAAELSVRYFKEQRARLAGTSLAGKPFKCGPAPNAAVWEAFIREFFAGVDLVPPC